MHRCPSCGRAHTCKKPDACMCQFPDAVFPTGVLCESCDMARGDDIDLREVYK